MSNRDSCEVGVENRSTGSPDNPNYYVRVDRLDSRVLAATVVDQEMIQRGVTEIEGPFASRRAANRCLSLAQLVEHVGGDEAAHDDEALLLELRDLLL